MKKNSYFQINEHSSDFKKVSNYDCENYSIKCLNHLRKKQIVLLILLLLTFSVLISEVLPVISIIKPNNSVEEGNNRVYDASIPFSAFASPFSKFSAKFIPNKRIVHIDLKGAPPKPNYLKSLIPLMRRAGATSLLIEYEDAFAYEGTLQNLSAINSYSKEDLAQIVLAAKENNLEIIPLVQTFGHLEQALKLQEFKHLREVPKFSQSICPTKKESWGGLIKPMLDQVLDFHFQHIWSKKNNETKYFHIGCDEVLFLGKCQLCKQKLNGDFVNRKSKNWRHKTRNAEKVVSKSDLFINHVIKVAEYLKQKGIQPIIWDDMLRSIPLRELSNSPLRKLVEPMVWVYGEDIDAFVDGPTWEKYSTVFPHIWTAGAYKGAFGERRTLPDLSRHSENNEAWLNVMNRESRPFSGHGRPSRFRGLVLTGWSRYSHFSGLCELLPVAVPSLAKNLRYISQPENGKKERPSLQDLLNCPFDVDAITDLSELQYDLKTCKFTGHEIYNSVLDLDGLTKEIEAYTKKIFRSKIEGWLTTVTEDSEISVIGGGATWRLAEPLRRFKRFSSVLRESRTNLEKSLAEVYDPYTVKEWLQQNVDQLQSETESNLRILSALAEKNIWGRRYDEP